jgi:Rps23 Pro-64 3,4-dihydroxylase Tpa1-like proline 4-hydroxylase
MNYTVYDNFLSKEDFLPIQQTMMGSNFPWFFADKKTSPESSALFLNGTTAAPYDFQFTHAFYRDMIPQSEYFGLLLPLIEKMQVKALSRIKANLTTMTPDRVYYGEHVDSYNSPKNLKTAVFYVNTNNGVTAFKDGPDVKSVENSLVIFDTDLVHTGTSCTDAKTRCLININFYDE